MTSPHLIFIYKNNLPPKICELSNPEKKTFYDLTHKYNNNKLLAKVAILLFLTLIALEIQQRIEC